MNVDKCESKCEIVHQRKIRFECVIECPIYCIDKCETKCEIAYQTKIGFECVIEWQIYCLGKY